MGDIRGTSDLLDSHLPPRAVGKKTTFDIIVLFKTLVQIKNFPVLGFTHVFFDRVK